MSKESLGNTDASQEFGNNPSPFYSTDSPNSEGEANLSPYKADYGLDIFDFPTYGPGGVFPHSPEVKEQNPLSRQESVVSPLINITYPRQTYKKWLVNLDTAQLFEDGVKNKDNKNLILEQMKLIREKHTWVKRLSDVMGIL